MKKQLRRFLSYTLLLTSMMSTTAFAQTDVHVLDVGQGLSVLIESQGHYMLYDGGDSSKSSYVVSYLQQEGVTSLDYVVASHYDADHLNGVVGALNAFPVSHVWGPDYTTGSKVFQAFQSVTKEHDLTVVQPPVGSVYELGDASIQVLSPSGDDYGDVNNYSIAIRVQDGDTSFLITGDAESESEQEMVSSQLDLESDVYLLGHHGSGTSTSWDLLQQVVPEYAIVSCGEGNSYGHPHIEAMEKLEAIWTPKGKSYHSRQNCATLKRSKTILSGSLDKALASGKSDPCNVCVR